MAKGARGAHSDQNKATSGEPEKAKMEKAEEAETEDATMEEPGATTEGAAQRRAGGRGKQALEKSAIERLNGLVLLDMAAVEAYGIAVRACSAREIAKQMESFRDDHARHVRELSEALRAAGATPPEQPDDRGLCIQRYTELSAREDRTALIAMRGNEELTNDAYASALASELPEELRQLVEANWQDERRHIRWISEEIRTHGWELPEVPSTLAEAA